MNSPYEEVRKALSLLESEPLVHPSGLLLSCFITEAVDPRVAANYVLDALSNQQASSLVSEWRFIIESLFRNGLVPPPPDPATREEIKRRDGNTCCISGKVGSIWDPLVIVPILRLPNHWATDRPQTSDMLGAFFGPTYRDWWLDYTKNFDQAPCHHNHWLVRKSVARAFDHGLLKLLRLQPSMIEYEVTSTNIGPDEMIDINGEFALLGDHSRRGVPVVDPRIVGTHARLAKSIRILDIEEMFRFEHSSPSPPNSKGIVLKADAQPVTGTLIQRCLGFNPFATILIAAWRLFPLKLRGAAYKSLGKLGELLYGRLEGSVQRLPLGLYLKYHGDPAECRNEFNALNLVHTGTTIPTPKVLDVVYGSENSTSYLLMTKLPGLPLYRCIDTISDNNLDHIGYQLGVFLSQLRNIRKNYQSTAAISDSVGAPCRDPRLRGGQPLGPFADEEAFSKFLMFPDHPSRRGHKIYFTHGDLNPRNILVNRVRGPKGGCTWKVSGIVDWETAGYYPEYWECTKSMFERFRWRNRYNDFIKGVFGQLGDYSAELKTEIESWENGDGV